MNELFKLLQVFGNVINTQIILYKQLLDILDQEEKIIETSNLSELDDIISQKDQLLQLMQNAEKTRQDVLKKICFCIAYDIRNSLPSLSEFVLALQLYENNVKNLLADNIFENLIKNNNVIYAKLEEFKELFIIIKPRIYRNKIIVQKLSNNISRSLSIFASEGNNVNYYQNSGKIKILNKQTNNKSNLRIKV